MLSSLTTLIGNEGFKADAFLAGSSIKRSLWGPPTYKLWDLQIIVLGISTL